MENLLACCQGDAHFRVGQHTVATQPRNVSEVSGITTLHGWFKARRAFIRDDSKHAHVGITRENTLTPGALEKRGQRSVL